MDQELLNEINAELLGVRQILWMLACEHPDKDAFAQRLAAVENDMRRANQPARAIETVRHFRYLLEADPNAGKT